MQTNKQKKRLKRNTKSFRKALPANESGFINTLHSKTWKQVQMKSHWKEINIHAHSGGTRVGHK
jgi:hypothetical protein